VGEGALADVERVVAIPERFKQRLAIGENAYATKRAMRSLSTIWDTAGAAGAGASVAGSAAVAGTFFVPAVSANPLVWIGLVPAAAAVTPIGWVVAAALAAGGAWYGVSRWVTSGPDKFVDVIPKFLNTPVDVLGMKMLDLHAGLAFAVAAADGHIENAERAAIRAHFEHDWGYDTDYLDGALPLIERDSDNADLVRLTEALVAFHHASRDCAPEAMRRELLVFLREVADADGSVVSAEHRAVTLIEKTLCGARALSLKQAATDLSNWGSTLSSAAGDVAGHVKVATRDTSQATRAELATAEETMSRHLTKQREAVSRWFDGKRDG
jgi:uncharacterized tellurite resistance protein B-like protein